MTLTSGTQFKFRFGTSAEYASAVTAGTITATDLYFITDTQQIYVGEDLYTGQVELVAEFPDSPSQGILYVNTATQEAKVYNGTDWVVVVPAISSSIDDTTEGTNLATVNAIKDYITSQVTASAAGTITDVTYDSTTGNFTFTVTDGDDIVVNTPVENFLSAASFDSTTNTLTLTLNDETTVTVDLTDLIDVYTADNTASINVDITNNVITATANVSATTDNALTIADDGLYVPAATVTDVASGTTVDLTLTDGTITAEAIVSTTEGNALTTDDNGLYVDVSDYITTEDAEALVSWNTI